MNIDPQLVSIDPQLIALAAQGLVYVILPAVIWLIFAITSLRQRVAVLENGVPKHTEIAQIAVEIAELRGELRAHRDVQGRLEASLHRVETYLLTRKEET